MRKIRGAIFGALWLIWGAVGFVALGEALLFCLLSTTLTEWTQGRMLVSLVVVLFAPVAILLAQELSQ